LTDMHESAGPEGAGAGAGPGLGAEAQPSEDELRAAYEAELNRITSSELIIQTAVSLLNVGGRRLGLAAGSEAERDLEQVRDAIDGVRALMPILERHMADELRPLRDALAQLQMAYAREASAKPPEPPSEKPEPTSSSEKVPGPAESSGRLWVPGR
jgi:Tetratrico peptide repeat